MIFHPLSIGPRASVSRSILSGISSQTIRRSVRLDRLISCSISGVGVSPEPKIAQRSHEQIGSHRLCPDQHLQIIFSAVGHERSAAGGGIAAANIDVGGDAASKILSGIGIGRHPIHRRLGSAEYSGGSECEIDPEQKKNCRCRTRGGLEAA